MKSVFCTSSVHPRNRFDYWHEVACRNLVIHESQPASRPKFQASIKTGSLADLTVVTFDNSPMKVARTKRQIARATENELLLCRQLSGILAVEQDGREAVLGADDVTLLDPLLPYSGEFSSNSSLLVLKIPRRALEARLGKTRDMLSLLINSARGSGELMSSFLAMLPLYVGTLSPLAEKVVRNQILDLLSVALTEATYCYRPKLSSAHSLSLLKLRAAIEARLNDPALDSSSVAIAAGMSVRYANLVLAKEGTSIMRLVQTRRLNRCRKALENPHWINMTLSEIAYAWGFADMTHFSRKFKAAYGMLPSEFRALSAMAARRPK